MQTLNQNLTPVVVVGQSPLPIDAKKFLNEVAFIAHEAATTNNPRVRKLGAQLLAMQAPTLDAIADATRTV